MSDTATQDIRTEALKVAGGITAALKRLDSEVDLPKIHEAITKLKTSMATDFKAGASLEKVDKYQGLLDVILKSMAAEEKKLGEAAVTLTGEIEAEHKKAVGGKASGVASRIATIKKDFLGSMGSYKSADTITKYAKQLKDLEDELTIELKKHEAPPEEVKAKWTISNKFKKSELKGNTDKYDEWLEMAENVGGKVAAMNLKLGATKMQGDKRFHFKLNKQYRVYFEENGKTVIVTGPEHEAKGG